MAIYWLPKHELQKRIGKTAREVDGMIARGEVEFRGPEGRLRTYKYESDKDIVTDKKFSLNELKEQHLEARIKREEQLLFANRLLLAENVSEIFIEHFHLPLITKLTDLVQKYGTKELIDKWNEVIQSGSNSESENLQQELKKVILDT